MRPPRASWSVRLADRVLRLAVSADVAAAILGDLDEELARPGMSRRFPRMWWVGQVVGHTMAGLRVAMTRRASLVRPWQDVRNVGRQWRRRPTVIVLAVVTLALAMGANITFFTLIDALAWRPLPVDRPDRLVAVALVDPRGQAIGVPPAVFREFAARQRSFTTLCGYLGGGLAIVETGGTMVQATPAFVTGEYLDVVGVHAFLGRLIAPADVGRSASTTAHVAVLGHQFWLTAFLGDPQVIGQRIRVDGVPFTVIGVTPERFTGMQVERTTDLVIPASTLSDLWQEKDTPDYPPLRSLIGRLRDGVTMRDARRELQAMWPSIIATADPKHFSQPMVSSAAMGFSFLRSTYVTSLSWLTGLATWMILVACVSVGGLLLAATVARAPEFRLRVALGASGIDLVRQLLIESLAICLAGAAVGQVLGTWAARPLLNLLWPYVDLRGVPLSLDWRMTAITAGATAAATVLASVVPAWLVAGHASLTGAQHARTVSPAHTRWQRTLLIAQLALSLALLVGAGLFMRTLINLRRTQMDATVHTLSLTRLYPRPDGYTNQSDVPYYRHLLEELSALPHVTSAALGPSPFSQHETQTIAPASASPDRGDTPTLLEWVSPGFFRTIGARVLHGRDVAWTDDGPRRVAVLSASLAARLFPAGDAVGQVVRVGADPKHQQVEVIGVVADTGHRDLRDPHALVTFLSAVQDGEMRWPTVVMQSSTASPISPDAVRQRVESLGHEFVLRTDTFDQEENVALLRERLTATLGAGFAALAGLLAAISMYGQLSHAVACRTREFGIRLALGAAPLTLRARMVREGVRTAAWGIVLGLPLAFALGRLAGSELYGLSPYDPTVFTLAIFGLLAIAGGAAYAPARRASRVNPIEALRSE